ncbi:MAG: hypothetical protein AAF433_04815 [Bacteroidota bacterium]
MPLDITTCISLEFIDSQLPGLKSGSYKINAQQTLTGPGIDKSGTYTAVAKEFSFQVQGERFALNPQEVDSVFPPAGSLGEYDNVLPHIVLSRNTLPWERLVAPMSSDSAKETELEQLPWMALMVLNQEDFCTSAGVAPTTVAERQAAEDGYPLTFKQLAEQAITTKTWPPQPEPGQAVDEKIKVIYLKKDGLTDLLPTNKQELQVLCHARQARLSCKLSDDYTGPITATLFAPDGQLIHQETTTISEPLAGAALDTGPLTKGEYRLEIERPDGTKSSQKVVVKAEEKIGQDVAVVVAKRLPRPNAKTVIHLVSLEERYQTQGDDYRLNLDGFAGVIPFVSLQSWNFSSLTPKETFRELLLHLNHETLWGMDADASAITALKTLDLPAAPTSAVISGALAGHRAFSNQAKITDRVVKTLQDKDHRYYFSEKDKVYNSAGRFLLAVAAPAESYQATSFLKKQGYSCHEESARFLDEPGIHLWIEDGGQQFFLSQSGKSGATIRLQLYALPKDNSLGLRLPERHISGADQAASNAANAQLQLGFVPLPHSFRRGGKSISWYRSPLLSGPASKQIPSDLFPVHCADELLRYQSDQAMFDTSYAAAWELGRLMALKSKRVSVALYNWKRLHTQRLRILEQQEMYPHLPFQKEASEVPSLPEFIEHWLSNISLLKGVPFNYLVPHEEMLPKESLRYFYLDNNWVHSLLDGALSIGRINRPQEKLLHQQKLVDLADVKNQISGIILRSSVVAGWPDLQVQAYDYLFPDRTRAGDQGSDDLKNESIPVEDINGQHTELELLRMEKLGPNVLFCLFRGNIKVLDIHEKPEAIHFGFEPSESENHDSYSKFFRQANGQTTADALALSGQEFNPTTRVLNVSELYHFIKDKWSDRLGYQPTDYGPAQFALTMVEGVERVRFIKEQ